MVGMQRRTVFLMHSLNLPSIFPPANAFIPELVEKGHGRELGARKPVQRVEW